MRTRILGLASVLILVGGLIVLASGAVQAKGKKLPAWVTDYKKLSREAAAKAEQGKYGPAAKLLEKYTKKHGKNLERQGATREDIRARGYAEGARDGAARFKELAALWSAAKASPATACRPYIKALLGGSGGDDFRASDEEHHRVLKLLKAHDAAAKALVKQAFPIRIEIKWLDGGKNGKFERRLVDRLRVASKKAGIPVVNKGGTWRLEQELQFAGSKTPNGDGGALGLGGLRVHKLTGNCRVVDPQGQVRAEWLSRGSGRTFKRDLDAKYKAAEKVADRLLRGLVRFVLEHDTKPD